MEKKKVIELKIIENRKKSKNQINIWCKIIKNAENDGRKCVQEYDNPKKKHKLSKWNKICKK